MQRTGFLAAFALASLALLQASATFAQAANALTGVYDGTYRCAGAKMNLRLAVVAANDGSARGRFTFSELNRANGASGSFNLKGHYDSATGKFRLDPQNWNPPVPPGFAMHGVDGSFHARTGQISGTVTSGCGAFRGARNKAESAKLPGRPPAPPAMVGNLRVPTLNPARDRQNPGK